MIRIMTLKVYFGMKTLKIILSETTMPRALVFGIKHHLMGFYQCCSIYGTGGKMAPPQRSVNLHAMCRYILKTYTNLLRPLAGYGLPPPLGGIL